MAILRPSPTQNSSLLAPFCPPSLFNDHQLRWGFRQFVSTETNGPRKDLPHSGASRSFHCRCGTLRCRCIRGLSAQPAHTDKISIRSGIFLRLLLAVLLQRPEVYLFQCWLDRHIRHRKLCNSNRKQCRGSEWVHSISFQGCGRQLHSRTMG